MNQASPPQRRVCSTGKRYSSDLLRSFDEAVTRLASLFGACTLSHEVEVAVRCCLEDLLRKHSMHMRLKHAQEFAEQEESHRHTIQLRVRQVSILLQEIQAQCSPVESAKVVEPSVEGLLEEQRRSLSELEKGVAAAARSNDERARDLEVLATKLRDQETAIALKEAHLDANVFKTELQMQKVRQNMIPVLRRRITARKQISSCRISAWYGSSVFKKRCSSVRSTKGDVRNNSDTKDALSSDSSVGSLAGG